MIINVADNQVIAPE